MREGDGGGEEEEEDGHLRRGRGAAESLAVRPNSLCSPDCLSMPGNLQKESPNAMWASLFLFPSPLV